MRNRWGKELAPGKQVFTVWHKNVSCMLFSIRFECTGDTWWQVKRMIKDEPRLNATDVAIDGPTSSLELAMHRMITADGLIASRSSISMVAALIGL